MPNERYYKRLLQTILMVPSFQITGSVSESSPMEKVKALAQIGLDEGDFEPHREFLENFDPEEEAEEEDDDE